MTPAWQICPKCKGQGIVSKPPNVPGDVYDWSESSVSYPCNLCNGQMIIGVATGKPPGFIHIKS